MTNTPRGFISDAEKSAATIIMGNHYVRKFNDKHMSECSRYCM